MPIANALEELDDAKTSLQHCIGLIAENQLVQLSLIEQKSFLLAELVGLQNAILLSVPSRNLAKIRARMLEIQAQGVPEYAINYPYCIAYAFEQIKNDMQERDSSFDNTPADIDAVLTALSTQEGLYTAIKKLDQFTRSYINDAGWDELQAMAETQRKKSAKKSASEKKCE